MLRSNQTQMNFFSVLYDRIPEDHLLKTIGKEVDFSFINEILASSYCANFGRPAKEPELMSKLLILKQLYNLSDVQVIREASYNLAYMWFLGLNPDDPLPEPSLLAKFRTQRLKDLTPDEIIMEIVRQCVEKGIIKGTTLAVDTTHTEANCKKLIPERIMKHLAVKLLDSLRADIGSIPEQIDTKIPDYTTIDNPSLAKKVMKEYLEKTMKDMEPFAGEITKKAIQEIRDILSDEKFLLQKGLRSLVDSDARVGYKSKTESFFGYKSEIAMITEERIITAVEVHDGAYVDGTEFKELLDRTQKSDVKVETVTGDKAYFRKDILDELNSQQIESVIPVSAQVYRIDESKFSYNKDSDQWICQVGNMTVKKTQTTKKKKDGRSYRSSVYTFDKNICQNCPHREECIGCASGGKKISVGENAGDYYLESQRQQTPEFKEKYRRRAASESKNAEMKRFHGMTRAKGWGLRSMSIQAKFTAIAVNLKRIAKLIGKGNGRTGGKTPLNSSVYLRFRFCVGLLFSFWICYPATN